MARNSFFSIALASALALAAVAPSAFAADIGSVEGFGGFAGRVGSQVTAPVTAQQPAATNLASVEGFGGLAGRVGSPAISQMGVAQNAK